MKIFSRRSIFMLVLGMLTVIPLIATEKHLSIFALRTIKPHTNITTSGKVSSATTVTNSMPQESLCFLAERKNEMQQKAFSKKVRTNAILIFPSSKKTQEIVIPAVRNFVTWVEFYEVSDECEMDILKTLLGSSKVQICSVASNKLKKEFSVRFEKETFVLRKMNLATKLVSEKSLKNKDLVVLDSTIQQLKQSYSEIVMYLRVTLESTKNSNSFDGEWMLVRQPTNIVCW